MGAYTGTPTVIDSWDMGDRFGKRVYVTKRISLTLSSQGGVTNNIPATTLGFQAGYLLKAEPILFIDGSANKRAVWCFTDGTYLYIGDPTDATDATRGEPADVTGNLIVEVSGI